jgi:hypothetical protein
LPRDGLSIAASAIHPGIVIAPDVHPRLPVYRALVLDDAAGDLAAIGDQDAFKHAG